MDQHHAEMFLKAFAASHEMSLHGLHDLVGRLADTDEEMPTVATFYKRVKEVDGAKAGWVNRRAHMKRFVKEWGDRRLDQVHDSDVELLAGTRRKEVLDKEEARQRNLEKRGLVGAPRRTGTGAERNTIAAARRFFDIAVKDGKISKNPAATVELPPRNGIVSRALSPKQLAALWDTVIAGGDDPELDGLLVWFHLETGARRGGALELRVRDLRETACCITLYEKGRHGKIERHQLVSRELLVALLAHANQRGDGTPGSPVFYYKDSTPDAPHGLGKKRYETLITRIRQDLPWARDQWMKIHDLRRTGVTFIERISGSPAVARLFAGHSNGRTLDTYDAATMDELAAAMAEYLGRPVGDFAAEQDEEEVR